MDQRVRHGLSPCHTIFLNTLYIITYIDVIKHISDKQTQHPDQNEKFIIKVSGRYLR